MRTGRSVAGRPPVRPAGGRARSSDPSLMHGGAPITDATFESYGPAGVADVVLMGGGVSAILMGDGTSFILVGS